MYAEKAPSGPGTIVDIEADVTDIEWYSFRTALSLIRISFATLHG
jgi:hypothetical protein